MITTVVFDLDDTLYNEIDYCKSGFRAVAKELAGRQGFLSESTIYDTMWAQFISGNYGYAFNAAMESLQIPYSQETIHELIAIYRNHVPIISLPALSRHVLDQLKSQYQLSLLTDGFLPAQELKVKALGIEHYFKCIIYTEALGREFWKPSPAGYQKIVSTLDVNPRQCVYVADNAAKDFIAPNAMGFGTIQVLSESAIHKSLPGDDSAKPKYQIPSLQQLAALLGRM